MCTYMGKSTGTLVPPYLDIGRQTNPCSQTGPIKPKLFPSHKAVLSTAKAGLAATV